MKALFIKMTWLKYVVIFRGQRDFKVWQDFKVNAILNTLTSHVIKFDV